MKSCAFMTPDDYPCLNEGTEKIGTKWYCEDHAEEMREEEEYHANQYQQEEARVV